MRDFGSSSDRLYNVLIFASWLPFHRCVVIDIDTVLNVRVHLESQFFTRI